MPETYSTISELPDYGSVQGTDRIAVDRLGAAVAAGAFVVDQAYQIVTVGSTNFAAIGAASNTVGVYFVATGAGTGSGTAAPINTGDAPLSAVAALLGTGPAGPTGATGPAGAAATISVGTVTTGAAGSSASVTNTGTSGAAVLAFTIPRGDAGTTGGVGPTGAAGSPGATGATGAAATISVGSVTTGAAGSSASVANTGTSGAAVLAFTIPRGDTGAAGATGSAGPAGSAATVSVGTVTTGAAGSSAAVTNVGTSSAAVLNFAIPRGDAGSGGTGSGTVTSVGLVAPTGFSVSGSPVTGSGNITLSFAAGYSLPLDTSQANWNTAFSERLRWDGSNTGLNATTARTSLGLGSLATQSGTFSGTSSGTNTGDNAVNTLYSGLVSNANHTGDATGSTVLTLATVNADVGSFGSATAAPTFTVNAKGLITAASSTTITPAVSSITGLGTGVATALAANVGSTGAPVVLGGAGGTPSSITLTSGTGLPLATGVTGILPVANGGTGTATPALVAGANVTISGSWPNHTISASGVGGGGGSNNNYAIGRYFTPFDGRCVTGSANNANTISFIPFKVERGGTVTEMFARVQTAAAGSSFQLAVYAMGANGDPTGLPIGATASMSSAAATGVADTLATTFNLAANTPYFLAVNVSTGTIVAFGALPSETLYPWTVCGPSSITGFNPGLGSNCFNNTLSHTFGTWPDVTGATFGTVFGNSRVPVALFKYGAFV